MDTSHYHDQAKIMGCRKNMILLILKVGSHSGKWLSKRVYLKKRDIEKQETPKSIEKKMHLVDGSRN